MTNHKTVMLAVLAVVVATFIAVYLLGNLMLALGFSGIAAYMLVPVVKLVERAMPWRRRRPGLARAIAVALVLLTVLSAIAGALVLIVPPSIQQTAKFIEDFPQFVRDARLTVEEWNAIYIERVPEQVRVWLEEAASNTGAIVLDAVQNSLGQTVGIISTTFSLILAFAVAPLLIFYLVKDSEAIKSGVLKPFPPAMKPHIGSILDIAHRTVGAYIRAQLTLALIVGSLVTVGLLLLGVPFAFLLGIVAGITELIPFIGPWVGGAVGVLVTLASAPHLVLWVILLYVGVQLLESMVLVPRIQGETLHLHPAVVLLIIAVASQIWGIWGVILGPPVASLIKDLSVYFSQQWNRDRQPLFTEAEGGESQGVPSEAPSAGNERPADDVAPQKELPSG
jgi:predicted PurR-regulated permease PerM